MEGAFIVDPEDQAQIQNQELNEVDVVPIAVERETKEQKDDNLVQNDNKASKPPQGAKKRSRVKALQKYEVGKKVEVDDIGEPTPDIVLTQE